ncbi:MAG: Gfo/Idh/MocA family oxidoreductase [Gemmatimonadetes bacterium]|nr:Gfo/Idh/MocA family oxidoreductase [Gemmatimonadota bacterium]
MDKVRLALIGCGGMGTRHLHGLKQLLGSPFDQIELAAVCDINADNAEMAAAEAEKLLGVRPQAFTDMEQMARQVPGIEAVDVVTDPSVHHRVVCQALDLGLHVLVEKPLAITVRACQQILDAAERNGRIVSVAENFRRDPSARIVRHLLDSGAIGTPYMGLYHSLGAGNAIFITPWRHRRELGGFILDMAVHFTHMIRYQLGDFSEVYADARMVEQQRQKSPSMSMDYDFYKKRLAAMPESVPAEAEDMTQAMFKMESGATLNWIVGIGGHGSTHRELILGDKGSIEGFGVRGGNVVLKRHGEEDLNQQQILASAESEGLELDPLTRHLFPSGVSAGDELVDVKLIAYELHELAEALRGEREVEVDGTCGLKDVAALYSVFESWRAGRPVKLSEVETRHVYAYQQQIDDALGVA